MGSHRLCWPQIYDLLTKMHFVLHYKFIGMIFYDVVYIFSLFVLCLKVEIYCLLCNEHNYDMITLGVLFFLLDISCIKHVVTYSIITFVIGIVSKTMIKCLYTSGKLWSKVMTTFSFHEYPKKQVIHECLNLVNVYEPKLMFSYCFMLSCH